MSTPTPNYVNPPTRPPGIQATCIVFTVLVTIALGLRLYTRACIAVSFGLDDVFAIAGTACAIVTSIIATVSANSYGWNRHIWDIPPAILLKGLKYTYVYDIIFFQGACLTKLSLLWFSRRLVGPTSAGLFRYHYMALVALMGFIGLFEIAYIITVFQRCRPLKAVWDPHPDYPHTCIDFGPFVILTGVINTVTDICCTILPAAIVMKLQMPFRQKVGVASVFLLGILVNIASILRIYAALHRSDSVDATWGYFWSAIAATFELGLGLLCVNIPSLRPLFMHYTNHLRSYGHTREIGGVSLDYYSSSRSGQVAGHDKAADSDLDKSQGQLSSIGDTPQGSRGWEGIEVTRTVELGVLPKASSANSMDERRISESGSQEEVPLRN